MTLSTPINLKALVVLAAALLQVPLTNAAPLVSSVHLLPRDNPTKLPTCAPDNDKKFQPGTSPPSTPISFVSLTELA